MLVGFPACRNLHTASSWDAGSSVGLPSLLPELGPSDKPARDRVLLSAITQEISMVRLMAVVLLIVVGGCADKSRGAALNECRQRYDIRTLSDRGRLTAECMQTKSFEFALACSPSADEHEWDANLKSFSYDNPQCYRPTGTEPWLATVLSPM